jgi:hypothetical protein
MEGLLELRRYIEQQRYTEAPDLTAEMEEMGREEKINKIYSFADILRPHLIRQAAEKRTTRSWGLTSRNVVRQITRINKRRKSAEHTWTQLNCARLSTKRINLLWNALH